MNIISITGLCIVATIVVKLFEKYKSEYGSIIVLATTGFILFLVISCLAPIVSTIESLFALSGVSEQYLEIIFKAIGICYIAQLGYDFCKDANENAIATQVELAGKISLLIVALPLFKELIEMIKKIISI